MGQHQHQTQIHEHHQTHHHQHQTQIHEHHHTHHHQHQMQIHEHHHTQLINQHQIPTHVQIHVTHALRIVMVSQLKNKDINHVMAVQYMLHVKMENLQITYHAAKKSILMII